MSLKRNELKKILKECLIEILNEQPEIKQSLKESVILNKPIINPKKIAQSMVFDEQDEHIENTALMENINQMALASSRGDKKHAELMKSIFADTAIHTLPKQQELGGQAINQGLGDLNDPGVELDSLFGGDEKRWATVAFFKK